MKFLEIKEIKNLIQDYKTKPHNGIKCGIKTLDNIIRMDTSSLAILVAKPNSGKSTFLDYYSFLMYKNNNLNTLFLSFETPIDKHVTKLNEMGLSYEEIENNVSVYPTETINSIEEIYSLIETAKKERNIDIVVIDTFSNLHPFIGDVNTYSIGKVLSQLKAIANHLNILILVSVHPTKLSNDEEINPYSICGSSQFYNLADFILSIEVQDRQSFKSLFRALKIRDNIEKGNVGETVTLQYNPKNGEYYDTLQDEPFERENIQELTKQLITIAKDGLHANLFNDKKEIEKIEKITDDFFNMDVSKFDYFGDTVPQTIALRDALQLGYESTNYQLITKLRKLDKVQDEKTYKDLKGRLNNFIVSSVYKDGRRKENVIKYNNAIVIDIDDITDIDKVKETIIKLPFVAYCALSCGGHGLFVIMPIGSYENEEQFQEYYYAIEDYFASFGIKIDANCKNINRLRVCSCDDDAYINTRATIWFKRKAKPQHATKSTRREDFPPTNDGDTFNRIKSYITDIKEKHLILFQGHNNQLLLGNVFAYNFGEDGRAFLHIVRQQYNGYDKQKTDYNYNQCLDYCLDGEYNIGTFVNQYKKALQEYEYKQEEEQNKLMSIKPLKRKE